MKLAHLTYLYLTLSTIIVAYVLILAFYPFKWLAYYNDPFPILNENKEVRAGDVLIYEVEYCRWNDKPTTFAKDIITVNRDSIVSLTTFESSYGANCADGETPEKVIVKSTVIPKYLEPGEYYQRMIVHQRINAIQTQSFAVETEHFTVIE